ncbi:phytoene/squalene synthase family protein [Microvirga sp. W0021]|uniref:Phytoene/squalene synthase family protein n=1 Tax=Hohaiivirga grylli TaxID=3133970 RepID=A0ABV0BMY8_9HYPH
MAQDRLDFAYEQCAHTLRQQDSDRYFASLFLPSEKRRHVMALYAFSAEIAHIQGSIKESLTGEIRLQWWRDALDLLEHSSKAGEGLEGQSSPVVMALADTVARFSLPVSFLRNLVDARVFDIYQEPMPTVNDLEGYCGETCSVLFQMVATILAGQQIDASEASGHSGVAYTLTGLLRAFPWHARHGKLYIPLSLFQQRSIDHQDVFEGNSEADVKQVLHDAREIAQNHLNLAEQAIQQLPGSIRAAYLPLCLVKSYLELMTRKDYQPYQSVLDIAQWRKQWTLWRSSKKPLFA